MCLGCGRTVRAHRYTVSDDSDNGGDGDNGVDGGDDDLGTPGPLLETFSGFLWLRLWSWRPLGLFFGCISALFGLVSGPFDIP